MTNLFVISQISPTHAVENIANMGFMGAALILMVFLFVWFVRTQKKYAEDFISGLNSERKAKDAETSILEKEFREHLKLVNAKQSDVIEHNTEAFQKMIVIFDTLSKKI